MKKRNNQYWIIFLATAALLGLGGIQLNWIVEAHDLKVEQFHQRIKMLTPKIGVALKLDDFFQQHKIVAGNEPIQLDTVGELIDSMVVDAGFSLPVYYAIFQENPTGIFKSNAPHLEKDLRNSAYKTCLSCIMTVQFMGDTTNSTTPEMTFIRSVSEMEKLPNKSPKSEFLWVSLLIPNQEMLSKKAIFGFFALTVLLMLLLIGLFIYVLKSLAQQKKMGQVKDDFFNNMTHEFKTPLASILLASKTLRKTTEEDKKSSYLNLIENESKKLEGQVDKILQLSLIDSNEMTFEKADFNLHQTIEEVIQRLKIIIENKNATINFDLQLKQPMMIGDATHFSNCLYNLVENALKYSGKSPKIKIATFAENGQQIISVKDQGTGIAKEHQAEIFDRFYRAQHNDQYRGQGFGIGLSYVKTVVEAHGGTVILNTNYKNGCEFIIKIG